MAEIRQALQSKMDDFTERVEWLEGEFDRKAIPASITPAVVDDIVSMQKAIKMIREMLAKTEAQ